MHNYAHDTLGYFNADTKAFFQTAYNKLEKNKGSFVNIDEQKVSITTFDTVYQYPEKVAIIINKGNASTTEQFLLAARQSKKVKLYGMPTLGALDMSNLNTVISPNGKFILVYATSKSLRLPNFPIDEIGIKPDYIIDRYKNKYDWITFIQKRLK